MSLYKSFRGKLVDMDELRRKQGKTIAAGNMKTNASGDVLGKGGRVVAGHSTVARKHYKNIEETKTISIKGDAADNNDIFTDDVQNKEKSTKTKSKRKTSRKEVETESGDIIIEEVDKNEGEST